jgi:hypothetical protein
LAKDRRVNTADLVDVDGDFRVPAKALARDPLPLEDLDS